jgi:hypothetical protein
MEPAPVTSTELFEAVEELPMIPELFRTLPPLEMTRLLPLPELPTVSVKLLDQTEPVSVTSTELFEAVEALPMVGVPLCTLPPLEMTRLLPLPKLPTKIPPPLDQTEPSPVTSTELFTEDAEFPINPLPLTPPATTPPLEMTSLLLLPVPATALEIPTLREPL